MIGDENEILNIIKTEMIRVVVDSDGDSSKMNITNIINLIGLWKLVKKSGESFNESTTADGDSTNVDENINTEKKLNEYICSFDSQFDDIEARMNAARESYKE